MLPFPLSLWTKFDSTVLTIFKKKKFLSRTLTSFYLPSDTVKVLHVEGETTTADVIRNLLKKFRVVDNPHKFALYVKRVSDSAKPPTEPADTMTQQNTLGRVRMRRLVDAERPLLLALSWKLG
jgi:hypothetical protein